MNFKAEIPRLRTYPSRRTAYGRGSLRSMAGRVGHEAGVQDLMEGGRQMPTRAGDSPSAYL